MPSAQRLQFETGRTDEDRTKNNRGIARTRLGAGQIAKRRLANEPSSMRFCIITTI